jgi:hypothetical protein
LTMEHISILLPPDYILKKQKLLPLREADEFTRCVTRSLVLCVCFVDRCLCHDKIKSQLRCFFISEVD